MCKFDVTVYSCGHHKRIFVECNLKGMYSNDPECPGGIRDNNIQASKEECKTCDRPPLSSRLIKSVLKKGVHLFIERPRKVYDAGVRRIATRAGFIKLSPSTEELRRLNEASKAVQLGRTVTGGEISPETLRIIAEATRSDEDLIMNPDSMPGPSLSSPSPRARRSRSVLAASKQPELLPQSLRSVHELSLNKDLPCLPSPTVPPLKLLSSWPTSKDDDGLDSIRTRPMPEVRNDAHFLSEAMKKKRKEARHLYSSTSSGWSNNIQDDIEIPISLQERIPTNATRTAERVYISIKAEIGDINQGQERHQAGPAINIQLLGLEADTLRFNIERIERADNALSAMQEPAASPSPTRSQVRDSEQDRRRGNCVTPLPLQLQAGFDSIRDRTFEARTVGEVAVLHFDFEKNSKTDEHSEN